MEFNKYLADCARHKALHPEWRMGQTYFNVLCTHRPDLSEQIRTTSLDPFYKDQIVPEFLVWVYDNWDGSVPTP